ncbi:MAG: F0F1 ATP synthase subunit B [Oscillatoriales cyanobacterium RM2_1_1]|nr:F0F1 ATP synthase subunit B [Oscillatoriales cyanobacterium SM2_3_0]NJO45121.1 F0F1 ATP synthase subunit B [Oscillatoriales cyanobacterium RM2_1_1]
MMHIVLLATEASSEGGFGLNFDILETNLINLAILVGALVYFGRGFLGKLLGDRRTDIEQAIQDAEQRLKQAAEALAEQQQNLTQAQTEAERIRQEAEDRAKLLRDQILAQSIQDVERMRTTSNQEIDAERERVATQLRSEIAARALEQAEAQLRNRLDDSTQQQLIDRSLALL